MIEQAERLHRSFFQPNLSDSRTQSWEPPIDVVETDREVHIIAAIPGVPRQDIQIAVDADTVIIAGQRRLPEALRGALIHRLEIPHGRFERRIRLSASRLRLGRSEIVDGCLFINLTKI